MIGPRSDKKGREFAKLYNVHVQCIYSYRGAGYPYQKTMSGIGKFQRKLSRSRNLMSIKIVAREGASQLALVEQVATAKHLTTSLVDTDVEPSSS